MRDKQRLIDEYIKELNGPPGPAFVEIERQLKQDGIYGINIGITEGTLLAFLVRAFKVKSILEVGTQYGYSTMWFLKNLPQDGKLVTLEKNQVHYEQARQNIKDPRCTLLCGDARILMAGTLEDQTFDLIFIDANKKAYPDYLSFAKDHVNPGGLIIGDNTFMKDSVFPGAIESKVDTALTKAMRTFNQEIFNDKRFESCIVPTGEGLTIGYRIP